MTYLDHETDVFTNHNVYILGAGFSKNAGIPVIKEFLNEMRTSLNWLRKEGWTEAQATKEVLLFRKQAASAALRVNLDVENIEDLFSLAAASGQEILTQSISTAIAATIEYCHCHTTNPTITLSVGAGFAAPDSWQKKGTQAGQDVYEVPVYDIYAGLLSGELCEPQAYMNNTVISFNYDMILENALMSIGVPIDYGFEPDRVEHQDSWERVQANDKNKLKVLKIHGSVNWFKKETDPETLCIYREYKDGHNDGQVFLIPPTWRKDFSGPLGDVWAQALLALRNATRIIFLGFSFPDTDAHIKYLMAAGLQENISLRNIFCINKDPRVKKNFLRVIRRDLEQQGIASFSESFVSNLIKRFTPDYRYSSEEFNRSLDHRVRIEPFSLKGETEKSQPSAW